MAEDYEDPRLTQMKYEMKMHEQLRKQMRNKSPLHGDSTYEHDKKVRALRKSMNASNRSISGMKHHQSRRKIGHKKKGDFVKLHFDQNQFEDTQFSREIQKSEKQVTPEKSVAPLKLKYDYQGSFRIGFDKKILNEDEK